MSRNPWGYAIDYDAAIAEDESALLIAEAALAMNWIAPDARDWRLTDLVFADLNVRAGLNLSLADLADLADYIECAPSVYDEHALPITSPGSWARGRAIARRLDEYAPDSLFASREAAAASRKLHMTRLARHRRNRDAANAVARWSRR